MDPTTLVTFLFKAPPEARTVELLGSWDNFRHGYKMHHDRRRGRGFWSGCFNFKDIVFDGDKADWSKPRSGGLKQGGMYWYFYRLNDAVEAFDDSIDYTQGCPLLPGQTVNVIDVPTEVEDLPSRRRSATVDVLGTLAALQRTHTLDPDDKWAVLDPPPVSRVHERCISDLALSGRLETKPVSFRETRTSSRQSQHGLSIPRQRSAGDTHSFRSRGTWSSRAPSHCDASIYDAHSVSRRGEETSSLSAFPLPNVYKANGRPSTRDGGRSCRGFDFAFDSASTRYSDSRLGDEDFDGSSFVFEPADSPPLSAYGSADWPFTVTTADEQTRDRSIGGGGSAGRSLDQRNHSITESQHRQSQDPDNVDRPDNDEDTPGFDICSPTFSAATISSNGGGLNTPFRLSAGCTPSSTRHQPPSHEPANNTTTAIEHVTERLRLLGSEDSAGSLASQVSTNEDVDEQQPTYMEHHYALPVIHNGLGMESATTLSKVSSGHASIAPQDLPPLPSSNAFSQSAGDETSFADAIFSELGYLGASIA